MKTLRAAWERRAQERGKKLGMQRIYDALLAEAPEMGLSAELVEELLIKVYEHIDTHHAGTVLFDCSYGN